MEWFKPEDDDEIDYETASCFDAIQEQSRFSPNLQVPAYRTKSLDNINAYIRYYEHVSSEFRKAGYTFTLEDFLAILIERIRSFKVVLPTPREKPVGIIRRFLRKFPSKSSFAESRSSSEEAVAAAQKPAASRSKIRFVTPPRKGGWFSDEDSTSPLLPSTPVISPKTQKNLLKKVYAETKSYAQKICKTMERISSIQSSDQICPSCECLLVDCRHTCGVLASPDRRLPFSPSVTRRSRRLEKVKMASGEIPRKAVTSPRVRATKKCVATRAPRTAELVGDVGYDERTRGALHGKKQKFRA